MKNKKKGMSITGKQRAAGWIYLAPATILIFIMSFCLQPLPDGAQSCPHCGKSFAGRNPGGTLPVGTVLAGRYTVGEMLSIDGEGILYRGAENLGRFRVTIKE